MKYAVFFVVLCFGVPVMAFGAGVSARVRGWLLTALIFATVLDVTGSIHFLSLPYRGPDRGFEVTLADVFAWSLLPALVVVFPRRVRYLPFNTVWMVLFFALAMLSSLPTARPVYSLFTLWKLVRLYLLYWCVVNCLEAGVSLRAVWRGVLATGGYIILLALQQRYMDGLNRVHGPFQHPNTMALYSLPIMPLLMLWGIGLLGPSRRRQLVSIVAGLGMVFVVLASQSRVALLLMLFNLLLVLVIANRWSPGRGMRVATAVLAAIFVLGGIKASDTILERFESAPEASGLARSELNQAASSMLRDHPILGVGINQYSRVLSDTPKYREHLVVLASEEQQGVCHHIYWLTTAEMGILGGLVFLVILGRFFVLAVRHAWRLDSPEALLLSACVLGSFAMHAQGAFEWVLRQTPAGYLFMILCAVIVHLSRSRDRACRL